MWQISWLLLQWTSTIKISTVRPKCRGKAKLLLTMLMFIENMRIHVHCMSISLQKYINRSLFLRNCIGKIDNNRSVHWLDIKSIYGWGLESRKMRGFLEHFPLFVPNTYIEFYVKSMHCYCLYTAIISDINGYYYQYSNYLKS